MKHTSACISLIVALGLFGCGGSQTRQDRAVERAESRTEAAQTRHELAAEEVEDAEETEQILRNHDPEAVEEANEVLEETQ